MEIIRYILSGFGYVLILISLIPLLPSSKWYVRIFDYPRSQKFWLNLIIGVVYLVFVGPQRTVAIVLLIAILL